MSEPPTPAHNPDFRRTDRLRGLVIVGFTFALCLVLSAWAKRRAAPVLSAPPAPPSSAGIAGFPSAVDVVKTLPLARALTPRPLLRGIVADAVKSDGTVDLAAVGGRARYSFQSSAGEGPEPPREVGMLAQHTYCGRQSVVLRKEGLSAELDAADAPCSPEAERSATRAPLHHGRALGPRRVPRRAERARGTHRILPLQRRPSVALRLLALTRQVRAVRRL